jgi:hypothetical protein
MNMRFQGEIQKSREHVIAKIISNNQRSMEATE